MLPENAPLPSPGEMLLEEFLKPSGMTQGELAARMRVPIQRVNAIVNGRRSITAETALLLSRAFKTSPEYWMNLQTAWDLWSARKRMARTG